MVTDPTSEAEPKATAQPPAEGALEGATAEGAEAAEAEVQEKDILAELPDEALLEHPRIKELRERAEKEAREKASKTFGKEKRRIAQEEAQRAQAGLEEHRARVREQVLYQIANEDDPERRQQLRAQLGMQEELEKASQRGMQDATQRWNAEGLLALQESGLLPSNDEAKAELKMRVLAKYGESPDGSRREPTYFEQVNELVAYMQEQYVPKTDVDKQVQEKLKALQESAAAEEAKNEQSPVEMAPGASSAADYSEACRLFIEGKLSTERFKELRRQFGEA